MSICWCALIGEECCFEMLVLCVGVSLTLSVIDLDGEYLTTIWHALEGPGSHDPFHVAPSILIVLFSVCLGAYLRWWGCVSWGKVFGGLVMFGLSVPCSVCSWRSLTLGITGGVAFLHAGLFFSEPNHRLIVCAGVWSWTVNFSVGCTDAGNRFHVYMKLCVLSSASSIKLFA